MKWQKALVPVLVLALAVSMAAGCARGPQAASEQELRYNLGTEPETLDPAIMTGVPEGTVVLQLLEGLTRTSPDGSQVPGIAREWEVLDNGIRYVFKLRDAKWSNGDPVTAHDFEYAWKRVLDPATGAYYAYQLYYIKNGEAFNTGEASRDDVGVRALDDKTLEVVLEAPCGYFLSLVSFQTYYPVPSRVVENNPEWWASAATFVSNGPFLLKKWDHHSVIEMAKNPDYWDAESVKLDRLEFYMVEESSTELTMYETGEIDLADNPPIPDLDRLRDEGKLGVTTLLGTYYYLFQTEQVPLNDPRVRTALSLSINRQSLVDNVTKGGQTIALAYVPPGLSDAAPGSDFRKVGGSLVTDNDVETAVNLLTEAGYPGGSGFPSLQILYNTSEHHKVVAEAIQEMWRNSLGITGLTLVNQEWQVYLRTRTEGNYQIARAGWLGDYMDPMTFLDMWVTDGGNNNTFWGDPEYDELITLARRESDPKTRFETMHKMESILMEAMPIAPIYHYVDLWVKQDYVMDVFFNPLGPKDFKWAWVASK